MLDRASKELILRRVGELTSALYPAEEIPVVRERINKVTRARKVMEEETFTGEAGEAVRIHHDGIG